MKRVLILGGNRFFGKLLAKFLADDGHEVTLANRGSLDDGLGSRVKRIKVDRSQLFEMQKAFSGLSYDVIYDQSGYNKDYTRIAIDVFSGKVGRYIFTSSVSAYQHYGGNLREEDLEYVDLAPDQPGGQYGKDKRDSEEMLFREAKFPTVAVRFPYVVGPGDWLQRLQWHVQKVEAGEPIYFPNIEAKFSPMSAEDAARALVFLMGHTMTGAVNVAPKDPMSLRQMMEWIEAGVGKKAVYADVGSEDSFTPFGIEKDFWQNVEKLERAGFVAKSILEGKLP